MTKFSSYCDSLFNDSTEFVSVPPSYQTSIVPYTKDLMNITDEEENSDCQIMNRIIGPVLPTLHRGIFLACKSSGLINETLVSHYNLLEKSAQGLCRKVDKLIKDTWKLKLNNNNMISYAYQFVLAYDLCFADLPFTGNTIIDSFDLKVLKELYVDLFSSSKIIKLSMKSKNRQLIASSYKEEFQDLIADKLKTKYGYCIPSNSEYFCRAIFTLTLVLYSNKMALFKYNNYNETSEVVFERHGLSKFKTHLRNFFN
ncbi:hypothetical protein KGF54_004479 [Candida jiufengensis]|uniref:uncharacterized protein n=1 Tax=Candida jiufengensis TaxID=497108 RepID=UPI0022242262|nr:uncharacterized protein KGF54_004479 [Candida jiufengensis]KAI5951405.1 hypothetical protein KGF54_004479 [Candida jiufengensis]